MSGVIRPGRLKGSPSNAEDLRVVRQELAESMRREFNGDRRRCEQAAEASVRRVCESFEAADRRPREE